MAHGDRRSEGTVSIQVRSSQERTLRALKFLGVCWLLSAMTIVVPIAHFVLVPGFFIAGPIGAWFMLQGKSVVLGGEGPCPSCGAPLPIARSADKWPLTDLCTACKTTVAIEKTS